MTTVKSCKMIDAVTYGMIPSAEDREPRQCGAGEEVQQAQQRAAAAVEEVLI